MQFRLIKLIVFLILFISLIACSAKYEEEGYYKKTIEVSTTSKDNSESKLYSPNRKVYRDKEEEEKEIAVLYSNRDHFKINRKIEGYLTTNSISFLSNLIHERNGYSTYFIEAIIVAGNEKTFDQVMNIALTYEREKSEKKTLQRFMRLREINWSNLKSITQCYINNKNQVGNCTEIVSLSQEEKKIFNSLF